MMPRVLSLTLISLAACGADSSHNDKIVGGEAQMLRVYPTGVEGRSSQEDPITLERLQVRVFHLRNNPLFALEFAQTGGGPTLFSVVRGDGFVLHEEDLYYGGTYGIGGDGELLVLTNRSPDPGVREVRFFGHYDPDTTATAPTIEHWNMPAGDLYISPRGTLGALDVGDPSHTYRVKPEAVAVGLMVYTIPDLQAGCLRVRYTYLSGKDGSVATTVLPTQRKGESTIGLEKTIVCTVTLELVEGVSGCTEDHVRYEAFVLGHRRNDEPDGFTRNPHDLVLIEPGG